MKRIQLNLFALSRMRLPGLRRALNHLEGVPIPSSGPEPLASDTPNNAPVPVGVQPLSDLESLLVPGLDNGSAAKLRPFVCDGPNVAGEVAEAKALLGEISRALRLEPLHPLNLRFSAPIAQRLISSIDKVLQWGGKSVAHFEDFLRSGEGLEFDKALVARGVFDNYLNSLSREYQRAKREDPTGGTDFEKRAGEAHGLLQGSLNFIRRYSDPSQFGEDVSPFFSGVSAFVNALRQLDEEAKKTFTGCESGL